MNLNEQLFEAVKNNDIELVKALISQGANINATDRLGSSVLCEAIATNISIVKIFVNAGINLNKNIDSVHTPILFTLMMSKFEVLSYDSTIEILDFLIASGADLNFNNGFHTALDYAIEHNLTDIIDYLKKNGAFSFNVNDALIVAVKQNNIEKVNELINDNANVNALDYNYKVVNYEFIGYPIINVAIEEGYIEIVKLLKEHGAKTYKELEDAGN